MCIIRSGYVRYKDSLKRVIFGVTKVKAGNPGIQHEYLEGIAGAMRLIQIRRETHKTASLFVLPLSIL